MTWGSDDNDQARFEAYAWRRAFYDKINTWLNEPRNIMTYGTLCKLHSVFSYALLAMVISFFVYSPSALDRPWFTSIRFGLMFFLFIAVILTSIVRGGIELSAKSTDLTRRMEAVSKKVERLIEHAKKTGFDFDNDV